MTRTRWFSAPRAARYLVAWLALGSACAIDRWSPTLVDASRDAAPEVFDDLVDVSSIDALDADVPARDDVIDADVADRPVTDVDVIDADVIDADVIDADVPDADVIDADVIDVDVPDVDGFDVTLVDHVDVVDAPDAPDAATCSATTPVRCGATCCAGPCAPSGGCAALAGSVSTQRESCVWTVGGEVWCWGVRPWLGVRLPMASALPRRVPGVSNVRSVAMGEQGLCAVTQADTAYCWRDGETPTIETDRGGDALAGVRQIAIGEGFRCVLFVDGRVACKGDNSVYQLGRGAASDAGADELAFVVDESGAPISGVAQIVAGYSHVCARRVTGDGGDGGDVLCWGSDQVGQLGNGRPGALRCGSAMTPCDRVARPVAGLTRVVELSANRSHTCARRADGSVACWGQNGNGESCAPLAMTGACDGDQCVTRPQDVSSLSGARSIATSALFNCAVRTVSGVDAVACCGVYSHGQGAAAPRAIGGFAASPPLSLFNGWDQQCALTRAGDLRCWGDASEGAIADARIAAPRAVRVSGISTAAGLALGELHTCALLQDRSVRCWGYNRDRELGDGTQTDRGAPVATVFDLTGEPVSNVAQIAAGAGHTLARRSDDTLVAWGWNVWEQLGAGFSRLSQVNSYPRVVQLDASGGDGGALAPFDGVLAVTGGARFTCVNRRGEAWCWGNNERCESRGDARAGGACDYSVAGATRIPLPAGLGLVEAVSGGNEHACARLRGDGGAGGAVVCWGANEFDQITGSFGLGRNVPPTVVPRVTGATDLSAFTSGACAVVAGAVTCWGRNVSGALAHPIADEDGTPRAVGGLTAPTSVRMGDHFGCALEASGAVRCWGGNEYGQLGDGSFVLRTTPVAVLRADGRPLDDALEIAAGESHACARTRDSAVWCWGSDTAGQLGQGSPSVRVDASPIAWPDGP